MATTQQTAVAMRPAISTQLILDQVETQTLPVHGPVLEIVTACPRARKPLGTVGESATEARKDTLMQHLLPLALTLATFLFANGMAIPEVVGVGRTLAGAQRAGQINMTT